MDINGRLQPHLPQQIPDYVEACLKALSDRGLGHKISLGGAFGLAYYFEYRPTHDVDAWWVSETTVEEQQRVIQTIQEVLQDFGRVRIRKWGDVVSIELFQKDQVVFSFQIAHRSAQLKPSQHAPQVDVLLDDFSDILASKMVALIERGAPRDFRDIYTLCQERFATPQQCWMLWRRRQRLARGDTDAHRARLAIQTHLARIELYHPLGEIANPSQRIHAKRLRTWFKTTFLRALTEDEA